MTKNRNRHSVSQQTIVQQQQVCFKMNSAYLLTLVHGQARTGNSKLEEEDDEENNHVL